MPDTVFGLPVHALIVHATVVLVPLAALFVAGAAASARFRRWAGVIPPVAAVVALVLVPLTTSSGENLAKKFPGSDLVERHQELGDTLIWVVLPLVVLAVLDHVLHRRAASGTPAPRPLHLTVATLAVLVSAATLVDVVLIGHAGAEAAWSGLYA